MKKPSTHRSIGLVLLLGLGSLLGPSACGAGPRYIRCSNAGDCEVASADVAYCVQARCVECLGSSTCGDGNACIDGTCIRHCKDGRDCKSGQTCKDGTCG